MRAVRSQGNRSTERRLCACLVQSGLKGWKTHAARLPGKPDVVFDGQKVAVFVDGCFWHGCKRCYRRPKSNRAYWDAKVRHNASRDKRQSATLRRDGWRVVRFWEHEVRDSPSLCAEKVSRYVAG